MTGTSDPAGGYVHATAVVIGELGILIRGASGSGKSRLAAALLAEAARRKLFGRLVGDDQVALQEHGGWIVARPHPAIAGLIERRTEGVVPVSYEPACVIRCVVDLATAPLPRMPDDEQGYAVLQGVEVPRLEVQGGTAAVDPGGLFDRLRRSREPLRQN